MLSLVHLIYMAGDKCMRQNACSDCPRVSQHALVLGSSDNVQSDHPVSAQSGLPTIQPDLAQELLDSLHRDKPKGRRGIPSWNLSLVLHQLTKAPFEPLKEASLKHLTFKTVFLFALGSA